MMGLDLNSVLPPDTLVEGMQDGGEFDVSRVHSTLHAVLPALRDFARVAGSLLEKCMDKPTYRLEKEEGPVGEWFCCVFLLLSISGLEC